MSYFVASSGSAHAQIAFPGVTRVLRNVCEDVRLRLARRGNKGAVFGKLPVTFSASEEVRLRQDAHT